MSEKFMILFFSSSPKDQTDLRVNDEFRQIFEKVDREHFNVVSVSNAQAADVQALLLRNKPKIVHFAGHGSSDAVLFENAGNESQRVPKKALIDMFRALDEKPELIFLNACETATNLTSLSETVDFVVATCQPVFDHHAIDFAASFYEYLSLGASVDTAFVLAKNQVNFTGAKHEADRLINELIVRDAKSASRDSKPEMEKYQLFVRSGADMQKTFVSKASVSDEAGKPPRDSGNIINIINELNNAQKVNFAHTIIEH